MAKAAAGGEAPGMERDELKKHIRIARGSGTEGIPFAFAIGGDGAAVLQMKKVGRSAALFAEMKKVDGAKKHTHGTLTFDPNEPTTAIFNLEKAVGGIARVLTKALKGTGAAKVKIVVDGTEVEVHEEPDGELEIDIDTHHGQGHGKGHHEEHGQQGHQAHPANGQAQQQTSPPQPPQPPQPQPAQPPQPQQQAGEPDAKALNATLTGMVKRMLDAVKRDPGQKGELTELAVQAKKSLDSGDLATAKADIEVFGMALDAVGGGGSQGKGNGQAHEKREKANEKHHGANHPAAPAIDKSRNAWLKTRQQIESQIAGLTGQFMAAFTGHPMSDQIAESFKKRVETVLHHLDESLSHTLADINKAPDPASRAKLVAQAHKHIAHYTKHVGSDPTIKELDTNPFVPMQLGKILTATLSTLSKSIH